ATDDWKSYADIESEAGQRAMEGIRSDIARRGGDFSKMSQEEQHAALSKLQMDVERIRAEISPAAQSLTEVLRAYQSGQADRFNKAVANYQQHLAYVPPEYLSKTSVEVFFNHFEPFLQCTYLYVIVFLLACIGWMV